MSSNRQPVSFGDVLHFLAFLAATLVIWYYGVTMHWPMPWITGACLVWFALLIATMVSWVDAVTPAVMLIIVHVAWFGTFNLYQVYEANNEARTDVIVVCKHYTTDKNMSSHIESRIRTSRGDFTLGPLKFISANGKVTYFTTGADAATEFPLGGSFRIIHKGGHWGASDVVKQATQLTTSVGACKK